MSDQTLVPVKKIKAVIRGLLECIDLLWMLEVKKINGNVDEESKKLQTISKGMQDKLTEIVGGINSDGLGPGASAPAGVGQGFDVGHFDKEKAEAAALANFAKSDISFNMNPFF